MPKKLVIHAAFIYTDTQTKQRRRAFRGETINVGGKDLERGTKHGAFGTATDLVPPGLDEGVVELSPEPPTGTPVVPLVSKSALLEAALRDRLDVEPGASQAQVLAALDAALAKPQTVPDSGDPAQGDDQGEPVETAELVEGQVDEVEVMERPPLAATKPRWEAFAVHKGMPAGEAAAKTKADLIALYGGED